MTPARRRRLVHRYRGLFPVLNQLAVAGLLVAADRAGIAATLMDGFRARIDTAWISVPVFFIVFVFGLVAALFPFYRVERALAGLAGEEAEYDLSLSLGQLAIDWLLGAALLTVLYASWVLLPAAWPLAMFAVLALLGLMNHPKVAEWTMARLPDQEPCKDEILGDHLGGVFARLGLELRECRTWDDSSQDLPLPAPGIVVAGRGEKTLYLPASLPHGWPPGAVVAAAVHEALMRKTGAATGRLLIQTALSVGILAAARGVAQTLYDTPSISPEQLPLPLALAALGLILIRPAGYAVWAAWVRRVDAVAAKHLESPDDLATAIRKTARLAGEPAWLPLGVEVFSLDGPSPRRRIRWLRHIAGH